MAETAGEGTWAVVVAAESPLCVRVCGSKRATQCVEG